MIVHHRIASYDSRARDDRLITLVHVTFYTIGRSSQFFARLDDSGLHVMSSLPCFVNLECSKLIAQLCVTIGGVNVA